MVHLGFVDLAAHPTIPVLGHQDVCGWMKQWGRHARFHWPPTHLVTCNTSKSWKNHVHFRGKNQQLAILDMTPVSMKTKSPYFTICPSNRSLGAVIMAPWQRVPWPFVAPWRWTPWPVEAARLACRFFSEKPSEGRIGNWNIHFLQKSFTSPSPPLVIFVGSLMRFTIFWIKGLS